MAEGTETRRGVLKAIAAGVGAMTVDDGGWFDFDLFGSTTVFLDRNGSIVAEDPPEVEVGGDIEIEQTEGGVRMVAHGDGVFTETESGELSADGRSLVGVGDLVADGVAHGGHPFDGIAPAGVHGVTPQVSPLNFPESNSIHFEEQIGDRGRWQLANRDDNTGVPHQVTTKYRVKAPVDVVWTGRMYNDATSLPSSDVECQVGLQRWGSNDGEGVAWLRSEPDGATVNFTTRTADGTSTSTDVSGSIDINTESEYRIEWRSNRVSLYVDGSFVAEHTTSVPTGRMGIVLEVNHQTTKSGHTFCEVSPNVFTPEDRS